MHWKIITVGKPALPWAKLAAADYLDRLQRMAKTELVHIRDGSPEEVAEKMLAAAAGSLLIVIDERGMQRRSSELAKWIEQRELAGAKRVCLCIGGADGHSERLRKSAVEIWSLSAFTLQHELALVVLLEQVYRACSINRGMPYHRE